MITSRKELNKYLEIEAKINGIQNLFIEWLTSNDSYQVHRLLRLLRYVEYYSYNHQGLRIIPYLWNLLQFRKMIVKTGIMVFPNTLGIGVHLVHPGYRRIGRFVKCGKNCVILPMVLCGRKRPTDVESSIVIGDNCYISTGVTILGPVSIGNNVTIGAGAVVTKDIPDNAIVGGVPAKIIKYKDI